MFGNGFYNPYMASNIYQTANLAGLGRMGSSAGLAGLGRMGNTAGLASKSGIGKGLLSKFSFSGFLNGASKTLNVVNQAIPIFYQVKPMFNNAKTMFKIMGAVKDDSPRIVPRNSNITSGNTNEVVKTSSASINNTRVNDTSSYDVNDNNPTFFI